MKQIKKQDLNISKEVVKGLISAMEDVKKGNYITVVKDNTQQPRHKSQKDKGVGSSAGTG